MRTRAQGRQAESGQAILLAIIIVFIIFMIVIGTIVIPILRSTKKLVPPPPPDKDGQLPPPGISWMGGTLIGYQFGHGPIPNARPLDVTSRTFTLVLVADSYVHTTNDWWIWTNEGACVLYSNAFSGVDVSNALEQMHLALSATNAYGTNGLPLEVFTNGMPPCRFYHTIISNWPTQ